MFGNETKEAGVKNAIDKRSELGKEGRLHDLRFKVDLRKENQL